MIKSVIKEIIIILLLLVAIVLALGVFFYDYIPTNKTVPSVATYSTSESLQAELDEQITNENPQNIVYKLEAGDITTYTKTKDYEKGKANPFSTYEEETPDGNTVNTVTTSKNNSNTTSSSSNTNTGSSSSGETFYPSSGTK